MGEVDDNVKSLLDTHLSSFDEKSNQVLDTIPEQTDANIRYTRLTKTDPRDTFRQGVGQGKNITMEGYSNFTHSRDNMSKSKYKSFI